MTSSMLRILWLIYCLFQINSTNDIYLCFSSLSYSNNTLKSPSHDLEMENREHIFDEEKRQQNKSVTFHNNQNGYKTTEHKTLHLLIIRSNEETITEEKIEQESENDDNESGIEMTTSEVLVYLSIVT